MGRAFGRSESFADRIVGYFDKNPDQLSDLEMLAVAEDLVRAFTTRRERLGRAADRREADRREGK